MFAMLVLSSTSPEAADTTQILKDLRLVADAVIADGTFGFIDRNTGRQFTSASGAPSDAILQLQSPYTDWRYWNGVLNIAMLRLAEVLHDSAYADFALRNVAFSFDNYGYFEERYSNQGKWVYPFGQRFMMEELDDCGAMGASVIEVYRRSPQERYLRYLKQVAGHMMTGQARLPDGTFVRAFPHEWTLWADDLYMSIVFLSRMGELSDDMRYFNDAARQVIRFHGYLFDSDKGLMHHCWYSDVKRPGVAYWGRANGWAMLAEVDLLDRLPRESEDRDTLRALLERHILGVAQYQSAQGLWHQLLDKVDSYLETSCSAMFTYVIARAVNKGYIEPRYASIARRGWEGIMTKIRSDGRVESVCTGTVVSDDMVYYYRRPAPLNDVHGIGAVLLAGSEILTLLRR